MKRRYIILILILSLGAVVVTAAAVLRPTPGGDPGGRSPATPRSGAAAPRPPLRPVPAPEAVDRIQMVRNQWGQGEYRMETITLEKGPGEWRLTSPVDYPANTALVNELVAALGEMRLAPVTARMTDPLRALQLDDRLGVDVTVYSHERETAHLIVGLSRDKGTYIRPADGSEIYRTPGRYRKVFDRASDQWRRRRITALDEGSVTRVEYLGGGRRFSLIRRGRDAPFAPEGMAIENFDADRARLKAEALTALSARGFWDRPLGDQALAGEAPRRVIVEAARGGVPVTVELTFGGRDAASGLHYLTTSASPQVFLVSPHLGALFEAAPEDFRRTDAQVERQRLWNEKAAAHAREHEQRRRESRF